MDDIELKRGGQNITESEKEEMQIQLEKIFMQLRGVFNEVISYNWYIDIINKFRAKTLI